MSLLYLLDTNILVHLVRRDEIGKRIQQRYGPLTVEPRPMISVVVAGELRSLTYQFKWGTEKSDQARFLLNNFKRISIDDAEIHEAYAVLDAYSESVGRSMGKNDLWMAATAKITNATILTTDKDFDHLTPQFIAREWVNPDLDRKQKANRS